jgi:hypothetical protein
MESMSDPDYLVCLECDTPTYLFVWSGGAIVEATCSVCGNDDPTLFTTEEELEEMGSGRGGEDGESDEG